VNIYKRKKVRPVASAFPLQVPVKGGGNMVDQTLIDCHLKKEALNINSLHNAFS
jgi:hypothetical protein